MWAFVFPTASLGLVSSLLFQHVGLQFFAYAAAVLDGIALLMWVIVSIGICVVFVPRVLFLLLPPALKPAFARQEPEAQG